MKKYLFICSVLIITLGACATSKKNVPSSLETYELSADSDINGLEKISGTLNYSGSEPFPTPTIFVSDTLSYLLMGDETFIKESYASLNGNVATLYGRIIQRGSLTYFEVHFYELIKD